MSKDFSHGTGHVCSEDRGMGEHVAGASGRRRVHQVHISTLSATSQPGEQMRSPDVRGL
jgi:hypothetical protein